MAACPAVFFFSVACELTFPWESAAKFAELLLLRHTVVTIGF